MPAFPHKEFNIESTMQRRTRFFYLICFTCNCTKRTFCLVDLCPCSIHADLEKGFQGGGRFDFTNQTDECLVRGENVGYKED
ncbi:hypothetical protein SDJN03_28790, partial [Cucurbita argyrosperma subsp. sororia]